MSDAVHEAPASAVRRPFLNQLGALRAFAVVAVLAYHLLPTGVSGGFAGVDILFVVSGYLITGIIARELVSTGGFRYGRFLSRRIVRLVPAAVTVIALGSVLVDVLVPRSEWQESAHQGIASVFYGENWYLAGTSKSYVLASQDPTIFQHFWSLGVEAQLYLAWPLLLLLAIILVRRARSISPTNRLILVLAVIFAASFAWGAIQLVTDPGVAFFSTATRAWEFAAGGLVAVIVPTLGRSIRVVAAAIGWATLLVGTFTLSTTLDFPGYFALIPVAATVLVIVGGPFPLYEIKVVQFLGVISYSVYLWHWPLLVVWPDFTGASITWSDRIAIVAVTLLFAWLTTRFVERTFWKPRSAESRRRIAFAFAFSAVLALVTGGIAAGQVYTLHSDHAAAAAAIAKLEANRGPCFGAGALIDTSCAPSSTVPSAAALTFASQDFGSVFLDKLDGLSCTKTPDGRGTSNAYCEYGSAHPTKTVAIIGDSHAAQWLDALVPLAHSQNWKVVIYFRGGCPTMDATGLTARSENITNACVTWEKSSVAALTARHDVSLVLTSGYFGVYAGQGDTTHQAALQTRGLADRVAAAAQGWLATGKQVLFLADTPHAPFVPTSCLATKPDPLAACAYVRTGTGGQDEVTPLLEKTFAGNPKVRFIDPASWFCNGMACAPVVGGVVVDFDNDHMTKTYAESLAPVFARTLDTIGLTN